MYRTWRYVSEYSILLILGAVLGLAWANLDPASYHAFVDSPAPRRRPDRPAARRRRGPRAPDADAAFPDQRRPDGAVLRHRRQGGLGGGGAARPGSLRGRKALTPLIATAGGMIGPAGVYLLGALMLGSFAELARGWAIPTATDIAFSYLVGRLVFGAGHPAVMFLLLLAIADDAGGLVILAVFYPQGELAPAWLLLSLRRGARRLPAGEPAAAELDAAPRRFRPTCDLVDQARLLALPRRRSLELVRLPAGRDPSGARAPADHPGDPAFRHRVRPVLGRGGGASRTC